MTTICRVHGLRIAGCGCEDARPFRLDVTTPAGAAYQAALDRPILAAQPEDPADEEEL